MSESKAIVVWELGDRNPLHPEVTAISEGAVTVNVSAGHFRSHVLLNREVGVLMQAAEAYETVANRLRDIANEEEVPA